MIKSSSKTTSTGVDALFKRLEKIAAQAKGAYVTVGVHRGEGRYSTEGGEEVDVAQVALWNEFGTVHAPERSFLRSTLAEQSGRIAEWRIEALFNIATKGWTVEKGLAMVGFRIAEEVRNKIKSNVPPPNAPVTVKNKEDAGIAPRTLIETGLMLRSVNFRVFVPATSPSPSAERP